MRILLLQTSFLGDVILSTPVIAGIKAQYPDSELWMMTTPAASELVRRDPMLAGVLVFDKRGSEAGLGGLVRKARELKKMKFDLVFALQRSARTSLMLALARIPTRIGFSKAKLSFLYSRKMARDHTQHDVLRNLSILSEPGNLSSLPQELRLFAPPDNEVDQALLSKTIGAVVMVPGSVWATKRWAWEHYRAVADAFIAQGRKVVLLGSDAEKELCEKISRAQTTLNLAGKLSLSEMMWVIKGAALVVCNDSMALHLASAFKIPTVAIFCATSPLFGFGPWQNRAVVVEKEGLSCKPCSRHGSMKCPIGTSECMLGLAPDRILNAARSLLAE